MPSTNPTEFKRFHEALTKNQPEYQPFYFALAKNDKHPKGVNDPVLQGSWKSRKLTVSKAVSLMQDGYNIAIAATNVDRLCIVDVDNKELVGEIKPTLKVRSRRRIGEHNFYFTNDNGSGRSAKRNITCDTAGEVRSSWQYVVCPGSYVPCNEEEIGKIPEEDRANAGKYTILQEMEVSEITFDELPEVYKNEVFMKEAEAAEKHARELTRKANKGNEKREGGNKSALYSLDIYDVTGKHDDPGERFPMFSEIHGSETGGNASVAKGLLTCWRHGVCHNALTYLAVASGLSTCNSAGFGHGDGSSSVDFEDPSTIYTIWKYAKDNGHLPKDDPIPTLAMKHLALENKFCEKKDITEGWKLPTKAYNSVIEWCNVNKIGSGREKIESVRGRPKKDFDELIENAAEYWNCILNAETPEECKSLPILTRLNKLKKFISNELHSMPDDVWRAFVENDVLLAFGVSKKDAKAVIDACEKHRNELSTDDSNDGVSADDSRDTEKSPDKYPQWAIDKANEILDSGEAFNFIKNVWQKKHVGDTNIGENCLCSVITSRILNSKRGLHIKPSGDSGKGKSDAIECFLELLPDGSYITGSMSAKALFYDKDLKPGTLVYSDDASFAPDVVSTIKQSTSKFQNQTIHRTVVNGEAQNFPIPERVTFWFSAVEGMDDEQLANRFLHADVDSSSEQDEKVFDHQVDSEAWYESDSVEPDVLICRCIFDILFNQFYRVKIPYVKAIIWNNKENRRNFDKFKDVIRSITVYNYRHREVIDGFLISTPEDYEEALKIYKGTSVNNATNLTNTEIKYLRFIVGRPNKTTTLKELVNHFKVTETAVRKMLNGKKGDGGLLAKIKQLIVIDGSQTVKSGDVTASTREKRYQYTGEFTGLDMYESISSLDKDEVGRVTSKFMAQMHENMLRVTQGNPEGNLSKVTLENDISIDNNNNNNTRVTQDIEERGGCNSVCVSVVESNSPEELTHARTEVTLSSEKQGYPHDKTSQMIAETGVTSTRLPQVREGYPSPINDIEIIENKGYPSTDSGHDLNSEESLSVDGNIHLLPLLRQALFKFAKEEYHSIVIDFDEFVRNFNHKTPDYKKTLGFLAVENEARKLKMRGWRF